MFEWRHVLAGFGEPDSLHCHGYEIARLWQRVDTGQWHATLRMGGKQWDRPCTSFKSGKAGCMAWAERHRDALGAEMTARHEEWRRGWHWGAP